MNGSQNRLAATFDRCGKENRTALILYLTAGFPQDADTVPLLLALQEAGADAIELGVPFSDPIADGPVIQAASQAALDAGASLTRTLEHLAEARAKGLSVPVVLFGAYNPFYRFGLERFPGAAHDAGADGVLVPDLPVDECDELRDALAGAGLPLVLLAAPTSTDARLHTIAERTGGFLYAIARLGVTGSDRAGTADLQSYASRLRAATGGRVPVALGFGFSKPEQVSAMRDRCEAIVVGSALIEAIRNAGAGSDARCTAARAFVRPLAEACRR